MKRVSPAVLSLTMIRDIVFDFYGTLVGFSPESVRDGERIAHDFFVSRYGEFEYQRFREILNQTYRQLLVEAQLHHKEFCIREISKRFLLNSIGLTINDDEALEFGRVHVDEWNEGTKFIDGMREFIQSLSKDYRLSIISNTHCAEILKRNLNKMGIQDKFQIVVTSIEHGMRKPHSSIFQHALEQLQTRADTSIYVGDTFEDDFLASKAVGMKSFLIDQQSKRPELGQERLGHIFELETRLQ